jgi:hypothetical protein
LKKLLFVVPALLMLASACVPVATTQTSSTPPTAYVDSVLPQTINQGDKLTFSGHGTDKTGSVVAFQWRSSEDGVISNAPSFSTSTLSVARHTIYFKVQNNFGTWSPEAYFFINVVPAGATKPTINSFLCTPGSVTEGAIATLSWNVSNATKVTVDPDIGGVSMIGSRTVSPKSTTTYIITASNDAGSVSYETKLLITTAPVHTVDLYSIAQENSSIRYDGITTPIPIVGVKDGPYQWQCFFSFDISMIPQNAVIKSASLDISNHDIVGSPFNNLGTLGAFSIISSRIGTKQYISPYPGGAVFSIKTEPTQPITSNMLTNAVQDLVSARSSRFQIRLQFEKFYYSLTGDNYFTFSSDRTKLSVTWEN